MRVTLDIRAGIVDISVMPDDITIRDLGDRTVPLRHPDLVHRLAPGLYGPSGAHLGRERVVACVVAPGGGERWCHVDDGWHLLQLVDEAASDGDWADDLRAGREPVGGYVELLGYIAAGVDDAPARIERGEAVPGAQCRSLWVAQGYGGAVARPLGDPDLRTYVADMVDGHLVRRVLDEVWTTPDMPAVDDLSDAGRGMGLDVHRAIRLGGRYSLGLA